MAVQYGAPERKTGPIKYLNGVKILSKSVSLTQKCADGWAITFNKKPASVRHIIAQPCIYIVTLTCQILKDEISVQEKYEGISNLLDLEYPPRIEITIHCVPTSPESGALCLHVKGLNTEPIFELLPGIHDHLVLVLAMTDRAVSCGHCEGRMCKYVHWVGFVFNPCICGTC